LESLGVSDVDMSVHLGSKTKLAMSALVVYVIGKLLVVVV
jgi:hypothetical protein